MVLSATAATKDVYQQYAELLRTVEDTSISGEDKARLLNSIGALAKSAIRPRITYHFRGLNLHGPCDILFQFEPNLMVTTALYEQAKLSEFENDLDQSIFQNNLVLRLIKNDFCKSILTDRTNQSLIVEFPVGQVVNGGSWLHDCQYEIGFTLQDHGYQEPVYRDGKYLR